ncbi:TrbC/VirB2 family protein [Candidatus Falkowbacteria bacterium]|jgi:hypothetical protein|nr:TrbC/VirB2 family protein [Candidatus Falkowbacteria bacterium]MBT7007708.1 TrbC/VirB2 family protein [Candidatus Falkowbacteria bacterium]
MKKTDKNFQLIIKITASCFVFLLAVFLFAPVVQAQGDLQETINQDLDAIAEQTDLPTNSLTSIIGGIIKAIMGFLGVIALSLVLYGGFLYMTAGGQQDKVDKAKKVLINAAIGLVIILSAYAITAFIFDSLIGDRDGGGGVNIAGIGPQGYSLSGGAFGSVIQSHYPEPEQDDVSRNTMIMVTFRDSIDENSVIDLSDSSGCPDALLGDGKMCGALKTNNIRIFRCDAMGNWPTDDTDRTPGQCADLIIEDAPASDFLGSTGDTYAFLTADRRTIVINPYGNSQTEHLGSQSDDVAYIVHLTNSITNSDGNSVFSVGQDYQWRFVTGTFLDLTPPVVESVIPLDQAGIDATIKNDTIGEDGGVYLNQIIVVNFSEPIIPPLEQLQDCSAGDDDNEIQVKLNSGEANGTCATSHVPGNWRVGLNGYKTVQFLSSTECSSGAYTTCGEKAFCLPENSLIDNLITAAELTGDGNTGTPGTGIVDTSSNSLDGDSNGTSDGPAFDNFDWSFQTGAEVDLDAPYIIGLSPDHNTEQVMVDQTLAAEFNESLEPYSVDREVKIYGERSGSEPFDAWVDPNMGYNLDADGNKVTDMKKIFITHGPFSSALETADPPVIPIYFPVIKSQVKDLRQNCFNPSREEDLNTDCGSITANNRGTSCCPVYIGDTYQLEDQAGVSECSLPGR